MYQVIEATPDEIGLVYVAFIGAVVIGHGIIRIIVTTARSRREW